MDEKTRVKNALLDWENEMNYCEAVLKSDASEDRKEQARKRIKECKNWISKLKAMI